VKKLLILVVLALSLASCTIRCLEGMCPPTNPQCRPQVVCCVMPQRICVRVTPPPTLALPTWTPTPVR